LHDFTKLDSRILCI